ncbi:MAG: YraN family protein [Oscillospiraceae bacterium]|jgi:putative endonuclease|nr:YraN family protein [Oscillospiraceae bacterium]
MRDKGNIGEDIAAAFLESKGLIILERNYYTREGEIDIIARDGEVIVFAEVKSRRDAKHATAREAVSPSKQRKLRKAAGYWLAKNYAETNEPPATFDVIEVYSSMTPPGVRRLRDAF